MQRISAVLDVVRHVFDTLLHPHLLLLQLSLPLLQVLNFGLQLNELMGNLTGIAARADTSGRMERQPERSTGQTPPRDCWLVRLAITPQNHLVVLTANS